MGFVSTGDVRSRDVSGDVTRLRSGAYVGIRSSARKPLVHAAIGLASVTIAGGAVAQEALPTIDVSGQSAGQGDSPDNTLQSTFGGISRIPGRVQDIPQTVNVINQQTMQQQGVTTVDQALRNVPGITASSGEGGGGQNGDQFRIRGFQAKSDLYVDGLRDFGGYIRDAFSIEQIQVLKGPASESFGYGTTGGAINLQQKKARLGNFTDIEGTVGTGPLGRVVADINRQIGETSAFRIVGMYHNQDLVDRDNLFTDRWGVLGSLGLGLGTDTQWTLNYMHQNGHRRPDMGTPIALTAVPGVVGKPLPEYGVPRNLFYGKNTDNDITNVDMFTSRFKHDFTNWLTVTNDTRFAYYKRFFSQTATSCAAATCGDAVIAGDLNVNYAPGGPAGYDQSTRGAQNITTAVAKFNTGFLRHELIAGVDVNNQDDTRFALENGIAKVGGPILNPIFNYPGNVYVNPLANSGIKESESFNLGIFGSDRVWLTEQFSILGGVRWDRFNSKYARTGSTTSTPPTTPGVFITPDLESNNEFVSPKASAIWEPTKEQTYYVTWSRSYSNLAGQYVAMDNVPINNATLQPEENDLWEAGLKYSMLNGKLGFTAAWFRVEKKNSVQTDPVSGDVVPTNETQLVQGVELGLTGKITDQWDIQASYAYMDSKILSALPANAITIGNRVAFVPENSGALWTTYDVAPMLKLPGKMLVGGGIFYTGQYFTNSFSTAEVPGQITTNLLWSYEYQKYRLALNVYNLFDEVTYDAAFANRAVVAAGRTITLTGGVRW